MKESDYIRATNIATVRILLDTLRHLHACAPDVTEEELAQVRDAVDIWEQRLGRRTHRGRREKVPPWPIRWATAQTKPGDVVLLMNQADPAMNGLHRVGRTKTAKR